MLKRDFRKGWLALAEQRDLEAEHLTLARLEAEGAEKERVWLSRYEETGKT